MAEPTSDRETFETLHGRLDRRLSAYLRRRVRDPDDAAELRAECWAAAYAGWRRCRATCDAEAEAWVFGIARHQLSRHYRDGGTGRLTVERLRSIADPADAVAEDALERVVECEALRQTLSTTMGALPPMRRRAVRLRVVHGLGYDEAAARLGCSEQAARAHVSRGLRQLAATLDREAWCAA